MYNVTLEMIFGFYGREGGGKSIIYVGMFIDEGKLHPFDKERRKSEMRLTN